MLLKPNLNKCVDPIGFISKRDVSKIATHIFNELFILGWTFHAIPAAATVLTAALCTAPLVVENGTIGYLVVEFAHGYGTADYRTHRIDYRIVIGGSIELI